MMYGTDAHIVQRRSGIAAAYFPGEAGFRYDRNSVSAALFGKPGTEKENRILLILLRRYIRI